MEAAAPAEETPAATPEPVVSVQEEASAASELEPVSVVEESSEPEAPKTCTVTFSDGQTFEATVGEDFVFFFQCDAPGDMGEPQARRRGRGNHRLRRHCDLFQCWTGRPLQLSHQRKGDHLRLYRRF